MNNSQGFALAIEWPSSGLPRFLAGCESSEPARAAVEEREASPGTGGRAAEVASGR